MNLIVVLEAFILSMVIFSIDFIVSQKGKEDDFEYSSYNLKGETSSNGKEGLVILSSYLIISVFLYFLFKAEPIRSIISSGRSPLSSSFIADILRNINKVRWILLNILIGLYGVRKKRSEGFIFIILSMVMPLIPSSFVLSNIFRIVSAILRILIFRKNILMIIYIISNFLILSFLIFGNMYTSGDLFYRFTSSPYFNLIFSNLYWIMIIAIIIEIIKTANIKDKNEL